MRKVIFIGLCLVSWSASASCDEAVAAQSTQPQPLKEETVITKHSMIINDIPLAYTATTGTLLLKDSNGKPKASIFYVAYTKDVVDDLTKRPVTFCFNGGPGSSAVWLHLGVLGPRRVELDDTGCAELPYRLTDNPATLLSASDLVFIDPVSTGYSKAAPGEDAKQFHSVEGDVNSVGEFIRLYTTRFNRWASPKFLAGESYGTTRAASLVSHQHDTHFMYFNGIILISTVLNFQTIKESSGNDLPYILFLPSYTAAAWYHKKLPEELQNKPLKDVLKDSELFAESEYSLALFKGDALDQDESEMIAKKLSKLTGLSETYLLRSRLRVGMHRFGKELLRDQGKIIGRFDSRLIGREYDQLGVEIEDDPSADLLFGGFAAMMNYYLRNDLKWERDDEYVVIANLRPWNYADAASNQYLNVGNALRDIMIRNPQLRTFIASGYYDLATPYFATDYTISHLGLNPEAQKRISTKYYEGGHMMYTTQPTLDELGYDLESFIYSSCPIKN